MIGYARFHSRSNPQRLVNPREIVVHEVERHRRLVVVHLLGEPVGQPREAPHAHPHGEVQALDVAGRNVVGVGVARDLLRHRADALAGL